MSFEMKSGYPICFKFIGVGDAGFRVMRRMIQADIKGIDLIAVHTDEQALSASGAFIRNQIRVPPANGQAVYIDPGMDSNTIEESRATAAKALAGADMVVIVADMGECIGTVAAPIVAGIARELGILTIAVVTKPFEVEKHSHILRAEMGIASLLALADSLVVIPNERLEYSTRQQITHLNAFEIADGALYQVVQTILNFRKHVGPICLDFSDVAIIIRNAGMLYVGVGRATGEHSGEAAAKMAISNPLTNTSMLGAKRLLINITASECFAVEEIERVVNVVQQAADPDAYSVFDAAYDETEKDEICVTVIASGVEAKVEDYLPNKP